MPRPPWSFDDAARAANLRALECRRRAAELRLQLFRITPDDVVRARQALDRARWRRNSAADRASSLLDRAPSPTAVLTAIPDLSREANDGPRVDRQRPIAEADLRTAVSHLHVSPTEMWIEYLALGGECSQFELEAWLHGALVLSPLELVRLEHVVWEQQNL